MKTVVTILCIALLLATSTARSETSALKTQTGSRIGLSLSSYQYKEPGIMSNKGFKMGVDLNTTKVLRKEKFIRGDLRYAFGTVDYNSNDSGTATGELDLYVEARGLAGIDLKIRDWEFTPYTGLGYRYLFNDARGISSTGNWGYRRESNYFYLPIGFFHRRMLNNQAQLESTLEYDHLLAGKQISRISDGGFGYEDVTNSQNIGYGMKLSIMYEKDKFAIGPFVHYWNISASDVLPAIKYGIPTGSGLFEPENNTVEFGLKVGQQF